MRRDNIEHSLRCCSNFVGTGVDIFCRILTYVRTIVIGFDRDLASLQETGRRNAQEQNTQQALDIGKLLAIIGHGNLLPCAEPAVAGCRDGQG